MKRLLLPLFLFFSTNCWASFPYTKVLDTFSRANSSTLGSNWSLFAGNTFNLSISSNTCLYDPTIGSNNQYAEYWNPNTFGANQEAYITVNSLSGSGEERVRVALRVQGTLATYNGYKIVFSETAGTAIIDVVTNGTSTLLASFTLPTYNVGDSFGGSAIGNVITAWYQPSGGSWTNLGSVTDTTYPSGGYIGLIPEDQSGTSTSTYVNFGGGTEQPALTANGGLTVRGGLTVQ